MPAGYPGEPRGRGTTAAGLRRRLGAIPGEQEQRRRRRLPRREAVAWALALVSLAALAWLVALPAAEERLGFTLTPWRALPEEVAVEGRTYHVADRRYEGAQEECDWTLESFERGNLEFERRSWPVAFGSDRALLVLETIDRTGEPETALAVEDGDGCFVWYLPAELHPILREPE